MTPSVERVLSLMESNFGATFKTYYSGDPDVIPAFNLPCLIVTQTKDDTREGAFGQDDVTDEIRIKLVFDKSDDYTGSINPLDLTDKRLRELVGLVDENNEYKPGTIKRVLRDALLDGVTAIAPTMTVEYGVNPRRTQGDSNNVEWTAEAWVTFSMQYIVSTGP